MEKRMIYVLNRKIYVIIQLLWGKNSCLEIGYNFVNGSPYTWWYNEPMLNWNIDEKKFKKLYPKAYNLWRLVQLINYGLDGEKLDKQEVKLAWPHIKDRLDPDKQKVLEFFLWHKKWKKEQGLAFDRSNFWQWYSKQGKSSNNST